MGFKFFEKGIILFRRVKIKDFKDTIVKLKNISSIDLKSIRRNKNQLELKVKLFFEINFSFFDY